MDNERRKETRFPSNLPVVLLDSTSQPLREPLEAKLIDISRSGLKLKVWHDAPLGTRFSLSLQSEDEDSLCLCEVVWKMELNDGMLYGLRILHWTYLNPSLASELSRPHMKPSTPSSGVSPLLPLRFA